MDSPIYRLEGVLHSKAETPEDFVGPLDLILHLLSKSRIEIQDIQISLLLDQYMEYLHLREEMDLEIASDFVVMAAHLMYIKSRMLLSLKDEEALSEMELLIRSLEERQRSEVYAKIKEAAGVLALRAETGRDIIVKPPEPLSADKNYRYVHNKQDLLDAISEILLRADYNLPPPMRAFDRIVGREPYPVTRKATEILSRLFRLGITRFRALFQGNRSRSEIVATFIAVLELCHAKRILLAGTETDCTVVPGEEVPPDAELFLSEDAVTN